MTRRHLVITGIVAAGMQGAALGQAVQWKVSEGGNGHWYRVSSDYKGWAAAKSAAEAVGGHLATVGSAAENSFISPLAAGAPLNVWIGGNQAAGSCEPGCGWTWATSETWDYSNWAAGEPNNQGDESGLEFYSSGPTGQWNDKTPFEAKQYVIEWEADCNGDGIVDYGQLLDGTLADANGNGVPDCCESGSCGGTPPGVAVEWRVSEGGNGHWYLGVPGQFLWTQAQPLALGAGGYLLTLTNQAEATWVWDHVAIDPNLWTHVAIFWIGPWSDAHKVNGSWIYDTGEPFWAPWCGGEPNGGYMEFYAHYYGGYNGPTPLPCWNDNQNGVGSIDTGGTSYIIEWSADCNNDGIVDYGQILSGELADANGNGIPDCCENGTPCHCPGDYNGDDAINGTDLAILLAYWGPVVPSTPSYVDLNGDHAVDGMDLAILLAAWGVCR